MSKPSWLIALENKWIKDGKDTSPVLSEFGFTKFWNEHAYPYLNGSAHAGFTPVGTVIAYFGETAPQNYLICDGSQYNKSDYPELWTLLSSLTDTTPYVVDGDNTKFKVPDLRGEFLRGTGTNGHSGQGSGGDVGEHQDSTEMPNFFFNTNSFGQVRGTGTAGVDAEMHNPDSEIGSPTKKRPQGTLSMNTLELEKYPLITIRPTNTSVLYCIAYKNIYIDAVIGQSSTEITNPQDGQSLVYDSTNDVWVNGAGGLHEYSTDEHVVGTWIDGRPIYESTISFTTPSSSGAQQSSFLPALPMSVIDNMVNISGYVMRNDGSGCQDLVNNYPAGGNSNYLYTFGVNLSDKRMYIQVGSNTSSASSVLTFQYTKTTDTPTVQS